MSWFNYNNKNLIKYELLSRFNYNSSFATPEIKKIVLNLGIKKVNFKSLLLVTALLEIISCHKSLLADSKTSNISLKIRKGYPVGCFITLRNNDKDDFLKNVNINIFSKLKQFKSIKMSKRKIINSFNFSLENLLVLNDLEQKYELFKDFIKVDISIVTDCKNINELLFLLISYRLPLK